MANTTTLFVKNINHLQSDNFEVSKDMQEDWHNGSKFSFSNVETTQIVWPGDIKGNSLYQTIFDFFTFNGEYRGLTVSSER